MIYLTRLSGEQLVVNADLIETVEHTANTTITLVDGKHLVVATSVEEVVERVVAYRQRIARGPIRIVRDDATERTELPVEHQPAVIALKGVNRG